MVASYRVVTNAHVVAGVSQPVVEVPGSRALPGRVVHFDPVRDLAVIAVDGLGLNPLPLGDRLGAGASAAFAGYPAGGPLSIQPASVQTLSKVMVQNIYGAEPSPLQVYTLAANVQPETRADRCWITRDAWPAWYSPSPRPMCPSATRVPGTSSRTAADPAVCLPSRYRPASAPASSSRE